jgi:hypothetical protein
LWVSDGTEENTYQLTVPVVVENQSPVGILENKLYFSGVDETMMLNCGGQMEQQMEL